MSYVAAATNTIHIAPNVLNLPLRPPAVVAREAVDLLTDTLHSHFSYEERELVEPIARLS